MSRVLTLLLMLTALLSSGCGYHLRGEANLPPEMQKTQLIINDEYSTLARRLRVMLERSGVEFVAADQASAILEIPQNRIVTEVLTIADNARVREYRVTATLRFRLTDTRGQELIGWQTLRQSREISFDEQRILASSREQEYLREDLAETMAQLLVARLESLYVSQG
ncbi:MAG: LPS assembly lipoprotein LptE [Xanthomonadales bacterium]|nr:LPS assembly lipoprotein LptE [Xanthomonadales bacterium]